MNIHFIGIAGAGCLPLALLAAKHGDLVSGSDLAPGKKGDLLIDYGVKLFTGHDATNLSNELDLVVYSSAIKPDNPELVEAYCRKVRILRRGEFLAEFVGRYRRVVAVSGSHGKSSVASLLAFALNRQGVKAGYAIGAQLSGDLPSASPGDGDIMIVEGDESDGSHTALRPYLGIVTNIDDDHAWSLGGEDKLLANFRSFGENSQNLIYFDMPKTVALYGDMAKAQKVSPGDFPELGLPEFSFPAANSRLVIAAALFLGCDAAATWHAMADFPGVERRMSCRYDSERLVVVEDYAHHPVELSASLEVLRNNYPEHYLKVIFQPHRQARLDRYIDEFAMILQKADEVIVAPLFEAWIADAGQRKSDAKQLARKVGDKACYIASWADMGVKALDYNGDKSLLVAVIGAGDVNKILDYLPGGAKGDEKL